MKLHIWNNVATKKVFGLLVTLSVINLEFKAHLTSMAGTPSHPYLLTVRLKSIKAHPLNRIVKGNVTKITNLDIIIVTIESSHC